MNGTRKRLGPTRTMILFKAALLGLSLGSVATTALAVPEFPAVCEGMLAKAAEMQKGAGLQPETTDQYLARVKGQMDRCHMTDWLERHLISSRRDVEETREKLRQKQRNGDSGGYTVIQLRGEEAELATAEVFDCMCKNAAPDRRAKRNGAAATPNPSPPIAQPSKGTHIDESCTESRLSQDALTKARALTQSIRDGQALAAQRGYGALGQYQAVLWGVPRLVEVTEADCKTGRSRFAIGLRETYERNLKECLATFSEADCQPRSLEQMQAQMPKIGPPAPPLCEGARMQTGAVENQKIDGRLAAFNQSPLGQSAHVLPKLQVIMWAAQEKAEALRAACEGRQNVFSDDIAKLQRSYQETKANCEKLASGNVCVAMSPEQITAAVEAEAQGNAARRAEAEAAARTTGTNPPLAPIDNSCSGDHSLTEYMMCQRMRCRDQGLIPVDAEGCVICGNVEGSKGEGFAWQKCHPSSRGGSAGR